jgi:broad specificity phosphatase PhoE
MNYLLVRHAQTDASRLTRVAFGKYGAPLNEVGLLQVEALVKELERRGINAEAEPVAVSQLLRAKQTAEYAGFKNISVNKLLNEINTGNPEKTLQLVAQGKLPKEAIDAATAILANPPIEKIWITHGLVIAALYVEMGQTNPQRFIPNYCEIREMHL